MFLKFDLKKINTSGLSYINDGQIPSNKIKNNTIINANITFKKPYKIRIRASKMVKGERIVKKKTITFEPRITLINALKKSSRIYDDLMSNLSTLKFVKQEFTKDMLYEKVFEKYIAYKINQYKAREDKTEFDAKDRIGFHNLHLKPILKKSIGMIDEEDLQKIITKIKKKGLSERTSRKVYQYVNPVFKYFNMKAAKFGINIPSPATQKDLPPLNNERGLELSIDEIKSLFIELKDYPITPVREIYMFLMHGRRFGEVVTLKWSDINFEKKIYTIRAENNKARINMTYHLSKRLIESLKSIGIKKKGYIFTQINDKNKPYSEGTIRNHWKNKPIVLHQIRNCIATYLKNEIGVGNDIVGQILGHKQNKTITDRYGKINYYTTGKYVDQMLDEIFDKYSVDQIDYDKLEKLKALFPDKSEDELKKVIDILK